MDKKQLRDGLMAQLWRMYSMDIMLYLREFLVGETALLECIASSGRTLTPGEISEKMHLSRARTANILRTRRKKHIRSHRPFKSHCRQRRGAHAKIRQGECVTSSVWQAAGRLA